MPRLPFRSGLRPAVLAALLCVLSACVSPPVFKDAPAAAPPPADVALAPERYHGMDVVWAGKILGTRNLADTTEVQVIAYPTDAAQRPDQGAPTQGRFIVVLPGYVEPLDFPPGRFLTVRGQLQGTRVGNVDAHDYVYPLLQRQALHLWPVNFPNERARVSFGLGVGVGLH
ncbi:MAG: Slp family lipoprotein [Dokdonella sp.]